MSKDAKCMKCKCLMSENRFGLCIKCRAVKCVSCGMDYTPTVRGGSKTSTVCYKCKQRKKGNRFLDRLSADMYETALY